MKNKKQILDKLKPIFFKVFKNKKLIIKNSSSSKNIKNWDSLIQITLILNIEREFKIRFKANEISDLKNVGEMIDLILIKNEKL
jgi:acyl carrier protein